MNSFLHFSHALVFFRLLHSVKMSTHLYLASLAHDLNRQCFTAAAAGVLSHILYFIRGYHDQHALSIILTHLAGYGILLFLTSSLVTATLIFTSYLVALFASMITYRIFFHPLRRFPGPLPAKITRMYGPYTNRHGRMHHEQNRSFTRYNSDIVRIGPNELMILRADAIAKLHASKSGCRKRNAGVYNVITFKGEPNLDSILDREPHRWRRQVWERAMTTNALRSYEKSTREVCREWLDKLASSSSENQPINTSLFSLLITFENMGRIGFAHEFGTLAAGKQDPMLKALEALFGGMAKMGELVWPVAIMQSLGVSSPEAEEFDRLTVEMADRRLETLSAAQTTAAKEQEGEGEGEGEVRDIFSHLARDFLAQNPTAYFNKNILYADAGIILVGATDTIAVVLSYAFYHLAKHQEYQDALYEEVAPVYGKTNPEEFADADLQGLGGLLEGILNETMRLDNPVCNNAARTTPPEGIVLDDGTFIPGGVSVRVPGYAMQRSRSFSLSFFFSLSHCLSCTHSLSTSLPLSVISFYLSFVTY